MTIRVFCIVPPCHRPPHAARSSMTRSSSQMDENLATSLAFGGGESSGGAVSGHRRFLSAVRCLRAGGTAIIGTGSGRMPTSGRHPSARGCGCEASKLARGRGAQGSMAPRVHTTGYASPKKADYHGAPQRAVEVRPIIHETYGGLHRTASRTLREMAGCTPLGAPARPAAEA
eukprot:5998398-Prymnesium_polylepis.1